MYICANFRNPTENPNPTHMYKLHKFRTFCTCTKKCFFHDNVLCSYKVHHFFSHFIINNDLACTIGMFSIVLSYLFTINTFFEIDTFTPDTSTLSPFSIYFLLFIKQQNTMVEIRNIMCKNILEKILSML